MDMAYRGIINMLVFCGCIGQSGGGWSHYVGQEKLRPQTGWAPIAFGLDWAKPPRHMNGTSFFYSHTDQWRYETLKVSEILSPTAPDGDWSGSLIDYNVRAERMGWLPSAPQLKQNPLTIAAQAQAAGLEPKEYVAQALSSGQLEMSCQNPDQSGELAAQPVRLALQPAWVVRQGSRVFPQAFARYLERCARQGSWRTEGYERPQDVAWHDTAPEGKLDLLVTLDFRMSTTCVYSDIVLPTATWYEKNDLNTSDMHPFIHPLTAAVDPAWEARTDWQIYKDIARKFSEVAPEVLGHETDVVLTPVLHDTAGELAQPFDVSDWKRDGIAPIPGPHHAISDGRGARLSRTLCSVHLDRTVAREDRQRWQRHRLEYRDEIEFLRALNGKVADWSRSRAATPRDRHPRHRGHPQPGTGNQRRSRGQGLGGAR